MASMDIGCALIYIYWNKIKSITAQIYVIDCYDMLSILYCQSIIATILLLITVQSCDNFASKMNQWFMPDRLSSRSLVLEVTGCYRILKSKELVLAYRCKLSVMTVLPVQSKPLPV